MLTFVTGRSGTGKTWFCTQEILLRQKRGEKSFYIVPEQFALNSEKELVRLSGGIMLVQAGGFKRLAYFIFGETGEQDKILDDASKGALAKKIVLSCRDEMQYYKASSGKQGFAEQISAQIAEFKRYCITPEILRTVLDSADGTLKLKLADIVTIYEKYEEFRSSRYITGDDILDVCAEKISLSEKMSETDIFIDGYKSFVPQEYRIIEALLLKCRNVFITLPLGEEKGSYKFYSEPADAYARLKEIALRLNVPVGQNIILRKDMRHKDNAFLHLADNYFFPVEYKEKTKNIEVVSASNRAAEINQAAAVVLNLTRERGYRFSDIGIIIGDESYAKPLKLAFAALKIPVFTDVTDTIASHPLTEYLRSLVLTAVSGMRYEDVFALLKTGFSPLKPFMIDELENYVLAYGIRGSNWQKEFLYGFGNDEQMKQRLNEYREIVLALTSKFAQEAKTAKKIKEFCAALYSVLIENNLESIITDKVEFFIRNKETARSEEVVFVWNKIISVLDKLTEILGDEQIILKDFLKILESALANEKKALPPPVLDAVNVGDVRRSRFPDIKALLVLGANEGNFPAAQTEKGLFSDIDKKKLGDVKAAVS
ncbi:MAG: hypothetical protein LBM16_04800, partial [Clostridiales bacterium]|nr:hypothetical protein [Clostridiales bacterium]